MKRYFIYNENDPDLDAILDYCMNTRESAKRSNDGLMVLVSLKGDLLELPDIMPVESERTRAFFDTDDNWKASDHEVPEDSPYYPMT